MWEAYLFQVTTGSLGPRISTSQSSWSISLNETESFGVDLKKSELPDLDLNYWLEPWWAGVVLVYDGRPIAAGPIISRPYETFDTIRLDCRGIRAILERRFVINELSDWTKVSRDVVQYKGLSLGTIAKRVVQKGQQKPGGMLPIAYRTPEQTAANDADHQRTYKGYNLQNIDVDAVLTKLSEVTNGPDVMFKPRFIEDNRIVFDLWTGSENDPRIPQSRTPIWDMNAVNSTITDLQIVTTGTYKTTRAFATGTGTNEALLMRMAEDDRPLQKGFPMLETVESFGEIKTASVVQAHANATLKANSDKLIEIQLTVRADGLYKLGTFWPGDRIQLVTKNLLSLKDGIHNLRLLNINGSNDNLVKLSAQTER